MNVATRRRGRVQFSVEIFEHLTDDQLLDLFKDCAALSITDGERPGVVVYELIHKDFPLVNANEDAPLYNFIVSQNEGGELERVGIEPLEDATA